MKNNPERRSADLPVLLGTDLNTYGVAVQFHAAVRH